MNPLPAPDRRALLRWSALAEAADGVAQWLVDGLGAAAALDWADAAVDDPVAATAALAAHADPRDVDRAVAAAPRWRARRDAADPDRLLERTRACRARVLVRGDDGWPTALDDLDARAPFALWARGEADLEAALRDGVALVGSRSATSYGEHLAADIAGDLATGDPGRGERPRAIVSGGAYGIDASAHQAALAAGGVTVAVMAGGIDRLYPAGHADLLHRVMASGAVISEAPPGHAPYRARFLERNRLIATAAATVVIEAAQRSGALSTVNHASALVRPVGAVPGPVTSSASAGCHALLRDQQAVLVRDAGDVWELAGPMRVVDTSGADGGADEWGFAHPHDRAVFDAAGGRGAPLEEVARRAGVSIAEALTSVGRLELSGLLTRRADRWVRTPR